MASSEPPTPNTTETSAEKPVLRRRRGPRCQLCKRQHQKCRFTNDSEACDRCLSLGYECRLLADTERRPTPPVRAPRAKRGSNTFKCDACRQQHQKCEPEDRVWPAKCTRCVKQKQPCSPPRDALGRDIPYIRDGGGGDVVLRGNGGFDSWPHPPGSADQAEYASSSTTTTSALSWPSHRRANSSASCETTSMVRTEQADDEAAPRIDAVPGEIVRRMEDEFRDVLGQLESRHARDMRAQRDEYEGELRAQRDRYEQRLDDMIRIMKDMGQSRRESLSN